MTGVRVEGHDHNVVMVADVDRSLAWYRDMLGLEVEREAEWRAGEVPFPSMRIDAGTVIDLFVGERTGENIDHVAMRVADDTDLDAVAASGAFDVVRGPIWVWGARGHGWALYVRDPDGNTVELKRYGGAPPSS
ncbi:MAG: VOC family protein [Actinomycetota bacterium]